MTDQPFHIMPVFSNVEFGRGYARGYEAAKKAHHFTQEDVKWLTEDVLENGIAEGGTPEYLSWLRSLIQRIESFLPDGS